LKHADPPGLVGVHEIRFHAQAHLGRLNLRLIEKQGILHALVHDRTTTEDLSFDTVFLVQGLSEDAVQSAGVACDS
jgi:hypothetical protein